MLALSIRQPYAELILRGDKTIEYRSRPTRVIGRRFAIYAARKWAGVAGHEWVMGCHGDGVSEPGTSAAADTHSPIHPLTPSDLPTGVLVGSAVICDCIFKDGWWQWHLTAVRRYKRPRALPRGSRPQPVWFRAA
ncbi:MAG: ASCH domain-containing protein [Phycisphaerales bacterium]|nr:ASCH domain-containing protein [Phycisphaerales bacterium]